MRKPPLLIPTEVDLSWRSPADSKTPGLAQVHAWAKTNNTLGLHRWKAAGGSLDAPWEVALGGDGSTALLFAVMETQSEAMAWLLQNGADPTVQNGRGRNALHLMAYRFHRGKDPIQDLDLLIRAGVPVNAREQAVSGWLASDSLGMTPVEAELQRELTDKAYRMDHLRRFMDALVDVGEGTTTHEALQEALSRDEFAELMDRATMGRIALARQATLQSRPAPPARPRRRA